MPAPHAGSGRRGGHVRRHVGDHQPRVRAGHGELESGLQVRLVEARVDPVRVEGLQVGVQVDALVHRVGEPVQALAGARVRAVRDDAELVDHSQAVEDDPVPGDLLRADLAAV